MLSKLLKYSLRKNILKSRPPLLLCTMSTESCKSNAENPLIGVCQLSCTADKKQNFQMAKSLVEKAVYRGAKMLFLPEAVDYIGETKSRSVELAESLEGETISGYQDLARKEGIWLSLGGFHQKSDDKQRVYNTHVIIDNLGQIRDTYSKTHLFDLDIKDQVRLCESDYTIPGKKVSFPVKTPAGNVGMEICYDLRFPELSLVLAQQGADILTFPSAFTVTTGMAHWEVLLRSRAIETQCYVVAAAQFGKHNNKRVSYGHSMVIDPWGAVVSQCSDGIDVCFAEINLNMIKKIRDEMPIMRHRRPDLYGFLQSYNKGNIDDTFHYQFGQHSIGCGQVFYKTALSFAFVNIKPVLPGPEVADLSLCVQRVCRAVEAHYKGTSLTIAVQDGPDSGQTVEHVHFHILPRKPADLPNSDDVYRELAKHDQDIQAVNCRSEEEMNREATELRHYFL